jgi:hypothetical protein
MKIIVFGGDGFAGGLQRSIFQVWGTILLLSTTFLP